VGVHGEDPVKLVEVPLSDDSRVIRVSAALFAGILLVGLGLGFLLAPTSEDFVRAQEIPFVELEAPVESTSTPSVPEAAASSVSPTSIADSALSSLEVDAEPAPADIETESEAEDDAVVLQLTAAVTDYYELQLGQELTSNILDNDRGAGDEGTITLTGSGELAPGFVLLSNGTIRGVANACGEWRAQYALSSENFGTSSSWIEIVVSGC